MCWSPVNHAIGVTGGSTALHANRPKFDHLVRNREQLTHRPKRFTAEILVETSKNDLAPMISKINGKINQRSIKELSFFN
jgi:hypothetical protein